MNCSCMKRDGRNCIELVPIFSNLNPNEMIEIAKITGDKVYEKGEMIYMAGDRDKNLYVIHKGKVKVSRLSSIGKEQVIRILGPGEFMGELALFSSQPLKDNAEAIEDTVVCIIQGEEIKKLMSRYPTIAFKIMGELSKRLDTAENLIESISLYSVEQRLAHRLLDMADEGNRVILNISRRDLASHLGMSPETLSRKLTAFQESGFIKIDGLRTIMILDKEGLNSIE